nr:hypothetical protein [Escherichia coli]
MDHSEGGSSPNRLAEQDMTAMVILQGHDPKQDENRPPAARPHERKRQRHLGEAQHHDKEL